jgi:Cell division protein
MQGLKFTLLKRLFFFCILHSAFCILAVSAQSTDQNFPTPVTSAEIIGKIPARDIGDARLTSYFYAFGGAQGDVFINIEATNLNGDIDIFTAGSLRPLTKIPIYAGDTTIETGRVIYLRKDEKLILRVQGRTPNDDPATFRIKFAGSFVAMQSDAENVEPKLPEVKTEDRSGIRVNSVGTIIEVKPKPTPNPEENEKQTADEKVAEKKESEPKKAVEEKSLKVITAKREEPPKPVSPVRKNSPRTATRRVEPVKKPAETSEKKTAETREKKEPEKTSETKNPPRASRGRQPEPKENTPDPMVNFRLIVLFKDGSKIDRPMNEILRVNVDKGVLTVISKDGTIGRYQIAEVLKMSIE